MKAGERYTPEYISTMCQMQVELVEDLGNGSWKVLWKEFSEGRFRKYDCEIPTKDIEDLRLMDADELWPITNKNIKPHVAVLNAKAREEHEEFKKQQLKELGLEEETK